MQNSSKPSSNFSFSWDAEDEPESESRLKIFSHLDGLSGLVLWQTCNLPSDESELESSVSPDSDAGFFGGFLAPFFLTFPFAGLSSIVH